MYDLFASIFGLLVGGLIILLLKSQIKEEYFLSPVSKTLELDWTMRQFFLLFSEKASQRWYESRAHLNQGVFVSFMAAFGLIYIVRLEFETSDSGRISYAIFKTHGFQSIKDMIQKLPVWIEKNKSKADDARYFYQAFISGHNVVCDCIGGSYY